MPARTTYRIRLPNDDEVVMSGEVWSYFRTLHDMTMDCDVSEIVHGCIVQIPLFADITKSILQTMIDFYAIVIVKGVNGVKKSADSPFHEEWKRIELDEQELIEFIVAANYLDARVFLVFAEDTLYTQVRRESTYYLEARVASSSSMLKRKLVENKKENVADRVRIHYRREQLIKMIMTALLPLPELVRGIDKRMPKYVNPIACITTLSYEVLPQLSIQYEEASIMVRGPHRSVTVEPLYKQRLSEVCGNGEDAYAILNTDGQLTIFGVRDRLSYKVTPVGNTRVIAMWVGMAYLMFMTSDTLYVYNFYTGAVNFIRDLEETSSVLNVSIGSGHALILTRHGLYTVYINDARTPYIAVKGDVHGATIRSILARKDFSIVVTTMGMVYASGKPFSSIPIDVKVKSGEWILSPALSSLDVQLIEGDETRIIVTNSSNETYIIGEYLRRIYRTPLKLLPVEGDIRSVISIRYKYFIVVTTAGIFVYDATPDQINSLGGTDSALPPYKLTLPFTTIAKNKPNKKARLDCHVCGASATMLDTRYSRLFCSRYCFNSA